MRLKRLDISGFKTFPEKSAIEFPPGISAIVGPNGCGKSNIFDAIKWVMGEQSIKQLRGKSMGDVIFAGTDKRAPVNMAEVSLTLTSDGTENSDARHPYPEIMITRRLYRSGETAYLLNKQPCRLKDIHNIFLGAGMGSKSCAIVQQGNIGAITEASADERRSFIEEAAGVMRYKTRKKEALAKVETTRQNLERLSDIIDEIQQQLSGLSQQADAAREYKRLQSRLKETEIQVAVYYYLSYARQIENAEGRLKALSEKDEAHTETLEELSARREEMQSDAASREAALSEKRTQVSEKQRRIDKLEADRDYRQQEKQRLSDELGELQTSLQNLLEKNEKLEAEITEEEESEEQLTAAIASIQSAMDQQSQKSRDIREQLISFRETLEEQQKRLMELSAYKARYQNICQNARANKENLKKRLKRLHADEAEALEAVEDLSRTESEEKDRLEDRGKQRDALQEQVTEARRVLSAKNESLGRQVKTVNTLSNERSRLRSRYSALKKMEDNYEWYKDGVKFIMRHPEKIAVAAEGRGSPIWGIIADFVTPAPGYALALEACLGEALQFILVTDTQTGRGAIDYLREKEAGRCGFLPLQQNSSAGNASTGDGEPQADYLLEHLSVRPGFEASIHKLLGRALVAGDFEKALQLREIHPGATVVTTEGDLITSSGVMLGGSTNKLTGIYEKKQEIRDLDQKITDLTENITKEEALKTELENEIREIETRLHEMNSRKTEMEKEVVQLEKDLYKTAERLKHARRQHEIVCLEKERLEGEKEDVESEIQTHDTALEEIKQDIAAADTAVNDTREKIDELSGQIKAFDQQEVDLKLDKTRLQAELDSARTTLKRLRKFSDDSAEQIESTRVDIEVKTEKQNTAAETIDSLSATLAEARSELEALNDALKSGEKHYHSLVRELKSTDNTIARTRQHLSRTQEERHQIELDLSRYRVNQENVVNRFLERYADSFGPHVTHYQETVDSPEFSIDRLEAQRTECKAAMEALGDVNLGAIEAYDKQKERYDFFVKHRDDLEKALNDLQNLIQRINRITQKLFTETFAAVNEKFRELFPRLFEGGEAWLELTQPNNPLETGVELLIHPPGKKVSRLSLLSGGEKALSAIAFIFAIFLINPASYCLLDEIDAPLDEVNIHRFNELLKIIGEKSQIIMVTHNKKSMEFAEMLYGVTMGENGVSRIVSVDIDKLLNVKSEASASPQDFLELQ